jgi:hypothetical protein
VVGHHAERTAAREAAVFLPHLRPEVRRLDVGGGPGTITLGLAAAVAPGEVVAERMVLLDSRSDRAGASGTDPAGAADAAEVAEGEAVAQGWTDRARLEAGAAGARAGAERPDAFRAFLAIGALGWVNA